MKVEKFKVLLYSNFEVSISWKDGELAQMEILSKNGGTCELRYKDAILKLRTAKGRKYHYHLSNMTFRMTDSL